jgi:hypothetical protein
MVLVDHLNPAYNDGGYNDSLLERLLPYSLRLNACCLLVNMNYCGMTTGCQSDDHAALYEWIKLETRGRGYPATFSLANWEYMEFGYSDTTRLYA